MACVAKALRVCLFQQQALLVSFAGGAEGTEPSAEQEREALLRCFSLITYPPQDTGRVYKGRVSARKVSNVLYARETGQHEQ